MNLAPTNSILLSERISSGIGGCDWNRAGLGLSARHHGETSGHRSTVPGTPLSAGNNFGITRSRSVFATVSRSQRVSPHAATILIPSRGRRGKCSTRNMPPAPSSSLPQITLSRPLVNVATAGAALDCHADAIRGLIEDGKLLWAFNISTEIHTYQEVRILAHCLRDFQTGQLAASRALDFAAVLTLIFPMLPAPQFGVIPKLTADTLARRFNCRTDHVFHLVNVGGLRLIGSKARRGPGGSPFIEFASVANFLRKRRII